MKIGGLIKCSLIDYPGKVSCVIFLSGCNFRCPYCHNPDLAKDLTPSTGYLDESAVFDFLESRKGLLDGVVVSGGEPTLQKGLISFCEKIKLMGYPVKLDTNGSRPEVIKRLIDKRLIAYLAMDIKTDLPSYPFLIKDGSDASQLVLSINIIKMSGIDFEFRSTCIRSLVNNDTFENMMQLIESSKLYALQQFNKADVLNPEMFVDDVNIYKHDELMKFKKIALKYVKRCIIR